MNILTAMAILAVLFVFGAMHFKFCVKLAKEYIVSGKTPGKNSGKGGDEWPEVEYEEGLLENFEDGTYEEAAVNGKSLFHYGIGFCWKV